MARKTGLCPEEWGRAGTAAGHIRFADSANATGTLRSVPYEYVLATSNPVVRRIRFAAAKDRTQESMGRATCFLSNLRCSLAFSLVKLCI